MIGSYKTLSLREAESFCDDIDGLPQEDFDDLIRRWSEYLVDNVPQEFSELRGELVSVFEETFVPGARFNYPADLEVGLALYRNLRPGKGPIIFTDLAADDDDFWRFLTIRVIPDLTYLRYPKPEKHNEGRLARKRFYSYTRRIWAKTLWWYIHLSWQGDEQSTREALIGLGSDAIGQLYERPGKGYRVDFTRALMRGYSMRSNKTADAFKCIRGQNTVDFKTMEPKFVQGGESGYVQRVLDRFLTQEDNDVH